MNWTPQRSTVYGRYAKTCQCYIKNEAGNLIGKFYGRSKKEATARATLACSAPHLALIAKVAETMAVAADGVLRSTDGGDWGRESDELQSALSDYLALKGGGA